MIYGINDGLDDCGRLHGWMCLPCVMVIVVTIVYGVTRTNRIEVTVN